MLTTRWTLEVYSMSLAVWVGEINGEYRYLKNYITEGIYRRYTSKGRQNPALYI